MEGKISLQSKNKLLLRFYPATWLYYLKFFSMEKIPHFSPFTSMKIYIISLSSPSTLLFKYIPRYLSNYQIVSCLKTIVSLYSPD